MSGQPPFPPFPGVSLGPFRQTQSPLLRVAHGGSPNGRCGLEAEGKGG